MSLATLVGLVAPFVLAAAASGCNVPDDSFTLDHARILAVRAEPSHVPAGGRARIDVLAGDDSGAVFEADPDTLSAGAAQVSHDADGWYVTAPAAVAGATLAVTLAVDGDVLAAEKQVVFGDAADNPAVEAMQVDGAASAMLDAKRGTKPALTAVSATPGLDYAWYSGVGKLEHARDTAATLDASAPATGLVVLVVRDDQGGVGWALLPATVE